MANYTNEKLAELAEFSVGIEQELARQFLAERQAAKAGVVTDEVVERACIAAEKMGFISSGATMRRVAMRAALASVWPTSPPSQPSTGVPEVALKKIEGYPLSLSEPAEQTMQWAPIEPTEQMLKVKVSPVLVIGSGSRVEAWRREIYKAMLAAAPRSP
jgi:hypothetical protein